jgi:hypothetical protein
MLDIQSNLMASQLIDSFLAELPLVAAEVLLIIPPFDLFILQQTHRLACSICGSRTRTTIIRHLLPLSVEVGDLKREKLRQLGRSAVCIKAHYR